MDFLRLVVIGHGPIYVRPEHIVMISTIDETKSKIGILMSGDRGFDLEVAGDADEVALLVERSLPGCGFYRMG